MELREITLRQVLPQVFADEKAVPSDVWRRDLTLHKGRKYIIEAASGTGKSSLCAYIYGNRVDFSGCIFFDGRDIRTLSIKEWQQLRRTQLAYLPQELDLFSELTALENIQVKNRLTDFADEKQIKLWMEELGIEHRTHFPVGRMSVGQQQRVAIVRALCQPFSFILLDEPVSHLDADNNAIVARIVDEVAASQGATIVATSVGNQLAIIPDKIFML